jgi:diguanylate cyclase (GGDEF)-like protein
VLSKITSSRGVARAAVVGLTLGLSALAGMAWWSTASTARTTASVRDLDRTSAMWGQVLLRVSVEYEALTDFQLATTSEGRQPLESALGSAVPELTWLAQHARPSEARQVAAVRDTYDTYSATLRQAVAAGRRGDRAQGALAAQQAALAASSLRKQVVANTVRKHEELSTYLSDVKRHTLRLRAAAIAVSSVDLSLLAVCAGVLLAYQRRAERQAVESRYRALHDALTGIGNRVLLGERMDEELRAAARRGRSVGLLLLDLDRFKEINDTLGHHHGDLLLQQVAHRLTAVVRDNDTVARLGGDEFAVLLPNVDNPPDALAIAERVRAAVVRPADLDGITVDVGASIGVAVYPDDSGTAAELLRHADIAMYTAKRGRLGVARYDVDDDTGSSEQLSLASELQQAIGAGQLVLHYQPKLRADTGVPCGVEALVRWQHPRRGLLGPGEFIELAEQSELILALTDQVLSMALRQHRAWRAQGLTVPVSVNTATRCLRDPGFPARVRALLAEHGTSPDQLTLEITESAVITNPAGAAAVLTKLRALGVRCSLDDFGTGYSSMAYLQTLPLSELKIDRRFVAAMTSSRRSTAIVVAVLGLARALELEAVAEGVEDAETWRCLADAGCEQVQGFHFSRPLPPNELTGWLAARSGPVAEPAVLGSYDTAR